jgi:hypothetical protein
MHMCMSGCAHHHAQRKRLYRLTGCNCTHAHTPSHAHTSQSHLSPSTYSLMCAFIDITETRPLLLALTSLGRLLDLTRKSSKNTGHAQSCIRTGGRGSSERATGHLEQLFIPWLPLNTLWTALSEARSAALLRR